MGRGRESRDEENTRHRFGISPDLRRQGQGRTKDSFDLVDSILRSRRESSGSQSRSDAENLLKQRLQAAARGEPFGRNAGRTTFEDLARILIEDYQTHARRSLERVEDALGHLAGFFGGILATEITNDQIASYIDWRRDQRAAAATINRELAALRRAFRLAQKAGKVAFRQRSRCSLRMNVPQYSLKQVNSERFWQTFP